MRLGVLFFVNIHFLTEREAGSAEGGISFAVPSDSHSHNAEAMRLGALLFVFVHSLTKAKLLTPLHKNKKGLSFAQTFSALICGEIGIRTPGTSRYNSFQDCRNRPLCHFSVGRNYYFFHSRNAIHEKKSDFRRDALIANGSRPLNACLIFGFPLNSPN